MMMKNVLMRGAAVLLTLALLVSVAVLPSAAEDGAGKTHTITFVVNGKTVGTAEYSDETAKEDIELPVYDAGRTYATFGIPFYRYAFEDFELTGEDITVKGRFTVVRYTVSFYETDESAEPLYVREYTLEDAEPELPEVPEREGFFGSWQIRSVDTNNDTVTFVAKYEEETREPVHEGAAHHLTITHGRTICRALDGDDYTIVDGVVCLTDETACVEIVSGLLTAGSKVYYYMNGLRTYKGVVKFGNDYYYFRSNGQMVANMSYTLGTIEMTHGLVPFGTYEFDEYGRMQNVVMKDGLIWDDDGELRYYENNLAVYKGIVADDEGNYYYINSTLKAVRNSEGYLIWPATTNELLPAGLYQMDENGVMDVENYVKFVIEPYTEGIKGVVSDGESGFLYYLGVDDKMVTDCVFIIYPEATNGLIEEGVYLINAEGVITEYLSAIPESAKALGAEAEVNITLAALKAKLMSGSKIGVVTDSQGNYYLIGGAKKLAKDATFRILASYTNGLIKPGLYEIDASGIILLDTWQYDALAEIG